MKIWVTRHGQTNLNKKVLMQGITDEPLNEIGIQQAYDARKRIGNIEFDAVFSSPLDRAIVTGSIIGNVQREKVNTDPRLIEMDFGKFELCNYYRMGIHMSLYWIFPDVFPAVETVETMESMTSRIRGFIHDLEKTEYENVMISVHGGIMRIFCGCLLHKSNGIAGRLLPKNCEIRVFESSESGYRLVNSYLPEK